MPLRHLTATFILTIGMALPVFAQNATSLTDITEAWLKSPHADRHSESFTHWDEDGAVPENCATCHSGPGFLDFVGADGTPAGAIDHPAPTGAPVDCATCHNKAASSMDGVTFPSGEVVAGLGVSQTCATCHQGRQSGDSVTAATLDMNDDTASPELSFLNIHYRAAAATMLGAQTRGGFQYQGKEYKQRFTHVPQFDNCTSCHNPHSLEVRADDCAACHKTTEMTAIRTTPADVDGDGDAAEGFALEIATLHAKLATAMQTYATDVLNAPIAYESHTYPYFFADTNGNSTADAAESTYQNRYQSWSPRLLRAAYNYQFIAKDPGAYAHNPHYAVQLMFDSIEDLASATEIDMTGLVRP